MKPALLVVGAAAACAVVVLCLSRTGPTVDRAGTVEAPDPLLVDAHDAPVALIGGERNRTPGVGAAGGSARNAAPGTRPSDSRLEDLEGRVRELEVALAAAERERDQLRQDLDWCRYPEDTPWGQALRLDELDGFDERTLRGTKALIEEQCPIVLRPGEPTWIATRYRDNDWPEATVTLSLIRFLGPDRLIREVPERIRDDLLLIYPDEFGR